MICTVQCETYGTSPRTTHYRFNYRLINKKRLRTIDFEDREVKGKTMCFSFYLTHFQLNIFYRMAVNESKR